LGKTNSSAAAAAGLGSSENDIYGFIRRSPD
jgi:hypothetical protein